MNSFLLVLAGNCYKTSVKEHFSKRRTAQDHLKTVAKTQRFDP